MAKATGQAGDGAGPRGKAPLKRAGKTHDQEYHVVWNAGRKSWDIHRDDGQAGPFAFDKNAAIGLAVREAQLAHGRGLDVIVCVEQADGTFRQEWASG